MGCHLAHCRCPIQPESPVPFEEALFKPASLLLITSLNSHFLPGLPLPFTVFQHLLMQSSNPFHSIAPHNLLFSLNCLPFPSLPPAGRDHLPKSLLLPQPLNQLIFSLQDSCLFLCRGEGTTQAWRLGWERYSQHCLGDLVVAGWSPGFRTAKCLLQPFEHLPGFTALNMSFCFLTQTYTPKTSLPNTLLRGSVHKLSSSGSSSFLPGTPAKASEMLYSLGSLSRALRLLLLWLLHLAPC